MRRPRPPGQADDHRQQRERASPGARPTSRASAGASAPKTAKASTGSEVSRPGGDRRHAQPVADLGQHRPDADRGRAQVERRGAPCPTRTSRDGRRAVTRAIVSGGPRGIAARRWSAARAGWPHAARQRRRAPRPAGAAARDRADRPGRGPGRRHPRDDRAARDRAGHASTSRCWPASTAWPSPTSTARSTTSARWSSSSRCGARCSSSRATCCRPPGAAPPPGWPAQLATRLAKEVESAGVAPRRRRLARRRRGPRCWRRLADGGELDAQDAARASCPSSRAGIDLAVGKAYGANVAHRAAGAHPARPSEGRSVRGRNGGHWRVSRPQWTLMDGWLGERAGPAGGRRGLRRAGRAAGCATFGPGTEADLVVVAGRAPRAPCARRWPTSGRRGRPRRRRDRLGAARRPRPGAARRAVGGAAAGPRPDRDGLEGARLLPRPARRGRSSTATATPAPPPGGTAGSSAAGCRTPTGVVHVELARGPRPRRAARPSTVEAERLTAWLDGRPGRHGLPLARDEARAGGPGAAVPARTP